MNTLAQQLNRTLGPLAELLSPLGQRMYFPSGGILGQGAQAKACAINATIGMAFEEDLSPLVMPCYAHLVNLTRSAFLYTGSYGLPALRQKWKDLQCQKNPSLQGVPFSLPVVTNALTHGLRIVGELFVAPGDCIVMPDLYWDNYALLFEEACGGTIQTFNTFTPQGTFDTEALTRILLSAGEKKILLLNFPNNPTGYTATHDEATRLVAAVQKAVQAGKKVIVVLDDAYFGLVYEEGIHEESLFAEFATLDPRVLAIKLDGTTKEDYVWGLRVGFITFGFKGATSEQLKALEAKAAGDVRSCVSNITSIGQHMALKALSDPAHEKQKNEKYHVLRARYEKIRALLAEHPAWQESFDVMPFNSGYFMCVKPKGVDSEVLRAHLIAQYSIGTIVLSGLVRLAFSTVPTAQLEHLFTSVDQAIRELKASH